MQEVKANYTVFAAGAAGGALICLVTLYSLPNIHFFAMMTSIDWSTRKDTSLVANSVKELCREGGVQVDYQNIVVPCQIDRSKHLNNASYLYELNFSRRHFFNSLGLWSTLRSLNANMVVQAQTIRYRRELTVFQRYRIRTRFLGIKDEEGVFYLESRFTSSDDFVAAIHVVKYKVVTTKQQQKRVTPVELFIKSGVLPASAAGGDRSHVERVVELWEESNRVSSRELNPR